MFLSCLCVLVSLCAFARGASGARCGAHSHRVPHLFRGCSSSHAARAARALALTPPRDFPPPSLFLSLCLSLCFSLFVLSLSSSSSRSHSRGSRGEECRASRSSQPGSRGLRRLCPFSRVSTSFSLRPWLLLLRCSLRFLCLRVAAFCSSRGFLFVSFVCSCSVPARDAASGFGSLGNPLFLRDSIGCWNIPVCCPCSGICRSLRMRNRGSGESHRK